MATRDIPAAKNGIYMKRFSVALLGLTLAGCMPEADQSGYSGYQAAVHALPQPNHGAAEQGYTPGDINSDNRSATRRTGISADPRNPTGMAGRPTHWYEN